VLTPDYNNSGKSGSILDMQHLPNPRWMAPLVHGLVFSLTWILYWLQTQPLLDGPGRWPFTLIFFGDLPLSVIAFGKMWDRGKNVPICASWLGNRWNHLAALHRENDRKGDSVGEGSMSVNA
jgi:hypothetical protein